MFVLQQQQNLGRRFGTSKMHSSPPPPSGLGRSVVRYFTSILVLQLMGKRERVALLSFVFLVSRDCCVALPCIAIGFFLQFVIVVLPEHTYLLFLLAFFFVFLI